MNDRALRNTMVGLGGKSGGIPRETGFDITAASEVMAILCLSSNLSDLKTKLGNIYVGDTKGGQPVYARDLGAHRAMAILLKDALKPNLVQTLEGNPAIIHGGPFANIAQGTNSILATKLALATSGYVVTEAGFGSDLGAEKFFNIKCRYAGIAPQAVVVVATIKALKYHGGVPLAQLKVPNTEALGLGLANLDKHIDNIDAYGVPVVVAVNRFASDSAAEVAQVLQHCNKRGVRSATFEGWEKGSDGALTLAEAVAEAAQTESSLKPLYNWDAPIKDKIATISQTMYGAGSVKYAGTAIRDIKRIERLGLHKLPVCMAKTQNSLSDNPKSRGRNDGFELTVRAVQLAAGAGFIIPIAGSILRMPGLPATPAALQMDIDDNGLISGLS